ncbi:glycerophosphodiester phosphodiesterase domain-containing protein 4 isoform X1 [Monodelphis domestica]|uniref:Glycerophosphodiester phosphodiesterase domain containing 4 n=1 Tax=Monodelphis domestica TaxID=13616 RepID=A0A5F8GH73_MONDO|nr:glycerophosphodiester phosphodiesterase domain-containing protein 4 isoform X1 [Monodelphis domestica]
MSKPNDKKTMIKLCPETPLLSLPNENNSFNPALLNMSKIKVVKKELQHRYRRHRILAFLQGLYSCHWKRYQWREIEIGACCCLRGEQIFFTFLLLTFCISFVFLYMWLEAKNDYGGFDAFVFQFTKQWFYWSFFLVIIASIMFTYVLLLMMIGLCLLTEGQQPHLHWSNKIGILLVLSICIFGMVAVTLFYEEKWKAAELSLQMTAPYLHIFGICLMVAFSWPMGLYFAKLNGAALVEKKQRQSGNVKDSRKIKRIRAIQFISLISFLVVLLIIYTIPLGISSPCIRENKTLARKPTFIGHRGAPMLAPENTQMSFEKAIEHGATGLETDVTLSYDGVPFLMHDYTLRRTTNIHEIMPTSSHLPSSMFTWQTLETLNSGQWFFKAQPFKFMEPLTKEDELKAKNQSVMKLSNFLRLANRENKLVIFDLYRPPKKHPYRDKWIIRVLEVILNEVGMKSHLVLWLPGQFRADVQMMAPDFKQVLGTKLPLSELLRMKINGLNLAYKDIDSKDIKEFEKYGIFTNIYVINEPWLYSLAWCAGVHSVTTNTIHILKKIKRPFFFMTPKEYMLKWLLLDFISAIVIVLVFFYHWWREKGWYELLVKKKSPVFPMSGVTDVEENTEEIQNQDENNENQEEIPVSPSPSDEKNPGDFWESLLEMKSKNLKMTRSLSTESVIGSNDEDMPGNTFPTSINKDQVKGSAEEEVLGISHCIGEDKGDIIENEDDQKTNAINKIF